MDGDLFTYLKFLKFPMRLTFCKVRATIELDLAAFENVDDGFPPCIRFDIVGFCC